MIPNDSDLLRRYAEERSEEAFAELVHRHLNLVYASALRRVGGDAHLAKDAAQQVFIALARNAKTLSRRPALAGWLYTTTRNASVQIVRGERRRHTREKEAYIMEQCSSDPAVAVEGEQLRPLLNVALDALNRVDREAVLLRFFEGRPFTYIGETFNVTEDAARMRVDRALVKLQANLAKRGITSTMVALSAALANEAMMAAPAGLATTITGSALAGAGSATLFTGLFMSTTKMTVSFAGLLGISAIVGIPTVATAIYEIGSNRHAQTELAAANRDFDLQMEAMRTMEKRLRSAEQVMIQANGVKTKGAAIPDPDPQAEGQKFLKAVPQARALLRQAAAARLASNPFFRFAHLAPEQIVEFENLMAVTWANHLGVTAEKVDLERGSPTAEEVGQVLGVQIAQTFQSYQETLARPYETAEDIAAAAGEAGVPLTTDQVDQLAVIIARNTDSGQGNATAASAVDWDAAITQTKDALSPAQFAVAQGALRGTETHAAITQAIQNWARSQSKSQ